MKKIVLLALAICAATGIGASADKSTTNKGPLDPAKLNSHVTRYGQLLSVLQDRYVDSLDMENLIRAGIDAMLTKIDPYTEFYDESNIDNLTSISSGNYGGIGSAIMLRDSVVVMSNPYYDSPARRAGIRHGDILLSINGEAVGGRDTKISDVSSRLRGNPGTRVELVVSRPWLAPGADSIFTFNFEREKIDIDPLPYATVLDGGVAYFDITTFNANTADEIRKAFTAMKNEYGKALKGVILDLRNNGGGIIDGAINLVSIFTDRGTKVTETRYRDGSVAEYKTRKGPVDTRVPIVVLINGNSASASEIVAGSIQDLDRGVIMGRRSYGKGLVQTSAGIGNGAVVKYTSGKYYLPSGRLIQALDYSNRSENGAPTVIPDSLTTAYKTSNGRTVRDGRGIAPDVALEGKTSSQIAYQLLAGNWIDDYANRYRNTHDTTPDHLTVFVTDSVFEDFKHFVDPTRLKYGEISKAGIDYLREAAKVEGLENDSVTAAIDNLEKLMKHDLQHELDVNREEIVEILESTIAERYFGDSTLTERGVATDNEIEQARTLLLDPDRYRRLLLPSEK